jgi:hypothetical protein
MKLRILTVFALAALTLVGCGDDSGATATTEEDTGGGITPADSSTTETGGDDTSVPADGTTPTDTGTPPADTMMATDTPAMGTAMKCGSVNCGSTQECCITAGIPVCIAKGGICAGARYGCTSPKNCPSGQVCCASGAGTGGASCTASGSCPSSTLCDTNADCSGSLKNCTDIGSGIKSCTK